MKINENTTGSPDPPTRSEAFARRVRVNQTKLISQLRPHYDFIVCGSGSSGSVVAGRLAENPDVEVLLLEAGGSDETDVVTNPNRWPMTLGSELDWGFVAEPNPHLNGRAIPYSMGKLLGGGSSINVSTWSRGHKADWDFYASESGDPSWDYQAVLDQIDANYLGDPHDLKDLVAGLSMAREIGNSAPFRPFTVGEVAPGPLDAAELERFFRDGLRTFWHQSGTAKMGRDAMSVVDGKLKIYGVEGLRIADASIMPRVTTRQHDGALRCDRRASGSLPAAGAQVETFTARSGHWDERRPF